MSEELKPCPFCECNTLTLKINYYEKPEKYGIQCNECFALSPWKDSPEEAIKDWDRVCNWFTLKPCPECGGKGKLERFLIDEVIPTYHVRCQDCNAASSSEMANDTKAINNWNCRKYDCNECDMLKKCFRMRGKK